MRATMRGVLNLGVIVIAAAAIASAGDTNRPAQAVKEAAQPQVVTLASTSPLVELQMMVRAGSADDPPGKEGTANLLAKMLIEGGFGNPKSPITKEKLAQITRPWGEAAYPQVRVDKQTTTFSMIVPRENLAEYVRRVLKPMLQDPLFLAAELDRIRKDNLVQIRSNLRFEQQEALGLLALDNYILEGTPLAHLALGTVEGMQAVTRADLENFYRAYYRSANFEIATTAERSAITELTDALPSGAMKQEAPPRAPAAFQGRHVLIITQPNAIATGIHFGFPIALRRGDPDYWPLFVANVFFGQHRDSFGRLYQDIREERGYNYGDYSYVEYYAGRPEFLYPPPTTPRDLQYFSMWIRPVGHQYAHFITKAATAELEKFVHDGLTPDQVAAAKIRARTLYLKYADSRSRQLGYRLDDLFYGMADYGYLVDMLKNIDAVTPERLNAALRKHLQVANLKYVIVTSEAEGAKLADDIANNTNVVSKTPAEYHMSEPIPPDKQKILDQDKQWAQYPLNISRENIRVVKAADMFEK